MKKGSAQMWWILMAAVLAFIVVLLLATWFTNSGGKGFGAIDNQFDSLGKDTDKDGVADQLDRCPGQGVKGKVDLNGCPKAG